MGIKDWLLTAVGVVTALIAIISFFFPGLPRKKKIIVISICSIVFLAIAYLEGPKIFAPKKPIAMLQGKVYKEDTGEFVTNHGIKMFLLYQTKTWDTIAYSNSSGFYRKDELPSGIYHISSDPPEGYQFFSLEKPIDEGVNRLDVGFNRKVVVTPTHVATLTLTETSISKKGVSLELKEAGLFSFPGDPTPKESIVVDVVLKNKNPKPVFIDWENSIMLGYVLQEVPKGYSLKWHPDLTEHLWDALSGPMIKVDPKSEVEGKLVFTLPEMGKVPTGLETLAPYIKVIKGDTSFFLGDPKYRQSLSIKKDLN